MCPPHPLHCNGNVCKGHVVITDTHLEEGVGGGEGVVHHTLQNTLGGAHLTACEPTRTERGQVLCGWEGREVLLCQLNHFFVINS